MAVMHKAKRLLILLTIFTFSGIGITYAAGNGAAQVSNFFLGGANLGSSNVNQVLALLVGPQGAPGPAGVAGKNGFVGMNGLNGKDGIPGAPGAVGPQGIAGPAGAVGPQGLTGPAGPAGANGRDGTNGANGSSGSSGTSVVEVAVDGNTAGQCYGTGGVKFTDGNGNVSYACNGSGGSGSSGSTNLGQGQLSISTCATTAHIALNQSFTGTDFRLSSVDITGITDACASEYLSVYFPIQASLSVASTHFAANDHLKCQLHLPASAIPSTVTLNDQSATCINQTNGNSSLNLSDISTLDLGTAVGFTIGTTP